MKIAQELPDGVGLPQTPRKSVAINSVTRVCPVHIDDLMKNTNRPEGRHAKQLARAVWDKAAGLPRKGNTSVVLNLAGPYEISLEVVP
jgi:hypothetical protein